MHEAIILGQGVVGSLLSFRFQQLGIPHVVIDRGHEKASSFAAAGIINPITGRRFVRSWKIENLGKELKLYTELAASLSLEKRAFIQPLLVFRDLSSIKALNDWDLRRSEDGNAQFMSPAIRSSNGRLDAHQLPQHSDWAQLGIDLAASSPGTAYLFPEVLGPGHGYRVDLQFLLKQFRASLKDKKILIHKEVSIDEVSILSDCYSIGGIKARYIIDCTGARAITSSTWSHLPWRGTKGEAARFSLPKAGRAFTVKRGMFLCPVGSEQQVWLGATNQDQFDDDQVSAYAKTHLKEEAAGFGVSIPKNASYLVGIRPTVLDRRPLVGRHPKHSGLWICNGMGTKGASLAPYCTKLMASYLSGMPIQDAELASNSRFV